MTFLRIDPKKEYPPGYLEKLKTKRHKPIQWEHAEQCALVAWARGSSAAIPQLAMLFAIPNGAGVHVAVRVRMEAEGVEAGIPDLFLAYPRNGWHGLFIEMKAVSGLTGKKGTVSEAQLKWKGRLEVQGYRWICAYNHEDAKAEILKYLGK